jgi:uncharacterized hydrophobic protein (TIGR00271 family)
MSQFFPTDPLEESKHRQTVRKNISDGAVVSAPFLIMNALATVIACCGLLQDSAAVVIGAMVIATLMGPITGIALALVDGNSVLFRNALLAAASGTFLTLSIGILFGITYRDSSLTQEFLARTQPTLLDLVIPLAGGAAGAYACVSQRLSAGLVGVAIATALVPPLSVCGICFGRGDFSLSLGAFLLFLSNAVAIQLASSTIFWLWGCKERTRQTTGTGSVLLRNLPSFGILLVLGVVFSLHVVQTMNRHRVEVQTRAKLIQALQAYPGCELDKIWFHRAGDRVIVSAEIRSPHSFDPEHVAALEAQLGEPAGMNLDLIVHAILKRPASATPSRIR